MAEGNDDIAAERQTAGADEPSPYSDLLQEQLAEERARKQSLEQRGFAALSTSGFLVSVLFGALGWANSSPGGFELSTRSKIGLGVALVSLLGAAILGVATNFIRGYQELSIDALPDLYARLTDPHAEAERRVFRFRSNLLYDARRRNSRKAVQVRMALLCQASAAVAVGFVVLDIAFGY